MWPGSGSFASGSFQTQRLSADVPVSPKVEGIPPSVLEFPRGGKRVPILGEVFLVFFSTCRTRALEQIPKRSV